MQDLDINITPRDWGQDNAIIKVVGVGGGGCNAVCHMYRQGIQGCNFIVCNTNARELERYDVPLKIQLGDSGLGAGTNPVAGRNAALETQDKLADVILDSGTKMLFITAGMGGGTGTGAAPVIAQMAKERGILTVAVVTVPFQNGAISNGGLKAFRAARISSLSGASWICLAISRSVFFEPSWKT